MNSDYDDLIQEFLDNLDDLKEEVRDKIVEKIEKDIKKIGKQAVDNYYDDYSRKIYEPIGSLYGVVDNGLIDIDGDPTLDIDNPDLISDSGHRVDGQSDSEHYIYDNMFLEGFHGGANFDNMLVPTQKPMKPYDGLYKPFSNNKKVKWKAAYQSDVSPYEEIRDRINDYYEDSDSGINKGMTDVIKDVVDEVVFRGKYKDLF